jgi:hypothetical protein
LISGGQNKDTYIARPGASNSDSVTFLGGAGEDKAVYGDDFNGVKLELSAADLPAPNQKLGVTLQLGDGGRADTLIGVEKVELSGKADTVRVGANLDRVIGKVVVDALGQDAGSRDVLDFSKSTAPIKLWENASGELYSSSSPTLATRISKKSF